MLTQDLWDRVRLSDAEGSEIRPRRAGIEKTPHVRVSLAMSNQKQAHSIIVVFGPTVRIARRTRPMRPSTRGDMRSTQ